MSAATPDDGRAGRRVVPVAAAVVIAAAVVGFLVGTRPSEPEATSRRSDPGAAAATAAAPTSSEVAPAVRYAEIAATARVAGDPEELARLAEPFAVREPPAARAPAPVTAAALAARADRRAYDGAPPVVPHAIDPMDSTVCLACHERGAEVDGRVAPRPSHPRYGSCTQCHVEARAARFADREGPDNRFAGLDAPAGGARAWQGAPPTVPHPTWMRGDCLACHGPAGRDGLRTTHPERRSCTQCHAPSAMLDQRDVAASPPPRGR